jgi:integrase
MHIYKTNGTWSFRIDAGTNPKTGKRKQISRHGFARKKDAEAAATKMQRDYATHTLVEPSDMTFKEFAEEWLLLYSPNVKVSTVRVRKHELGLLYQYFEKIPIQDITSRQYQKMLASLQASGFASNTISGVHGTARMVFKKAREFKLIHDDPTEFAKPPRRPSRSIDAQTEVPRYMEKDELARFLQCTRENGLLGDYAMFTLLAYTGMRVGELGALIWDDIDADARTVNISKTLYCPTNRAIEYTLLSPKTPHSYRVLDIDQVVIDALIKYRHEQNLEKMRHGIEWHNDHDFVFTAVKYPGYPKEQKSIQLRIDRIQKIIQLPLHITPHVFRHTHTSLLAEAGVPLHEIMDRLGHADDNTTRNIYLHVTKQRKRSASDKFAALLRKAQ